MTKRWERALRTLNDVPAPVERIRYKAGAGTGEGPEFDSPPRRQRVVAGVVAFAVFVTVGVFAWRVFDTKSSPTVGGPTGNLPVLSVKLQSFGLIDSAPDSSTLRVDTIIDYGDAHEESFTSTIPDGAHVDWVGVDALTPFVPGPTVGSAVSITSNGFDSRVLLGSLWDWPNFGRFERIDQLPSTPGDYVLLFEADYPEGTAMTARRVQVVEPGVLQLALIETSKQAITHATAYVDGEGVDGFLSERSYTVSDLGGQMMPQRPVFEDQHLLVVTEGSRILLGFPADNARAALVETYRQTPDRLPVNLLGDDPRLSSAPGIFLLAVDAGWAHGKIGYSHNGTKEKVRFFFPVEVVHADSQPSVEPSPDSDGTPPLPPVTGTIAYIEGHQAYGPITRLDVETESTQRLSSDSFSSITVSWAPDGSTVATTQHIMEGNAELVLVSATTGEIVLTMPIDPLLSPQDVDWAPDGQSLAFTDTYGELHTINADGSGLQHVSTGSLRALDAAWSPDGTEIAFTNDEGKLGVVDLESGNTDVLFEVPGESLHGCAWSPDGQSLAFAMSTDTGGAIFVIGKDGTGLTQLTEGTLNADNPTWSPNGSWIAFEGGPNGDHKDLYAITQDGSNVVQLTDTSKDEYGPDWG
jgi:Tol biopolymer transport system component